MMFANSTDFFLLLVNPTNKKRKRKNSTISFTSMILMIIQKTLNPEEAVNIVLAISLRLLSLKESKTHSNSFTVEIKQRIMYALFR